MLFIKKKEEVEVSVIYVNYKTGGLIVDSIQSVKKLSEDISFEIIVVDNCSGDGSVEQIKKACPEVTLIQAPENLGFGRANNLGIEAAKGEMVLFLNPDTLLVNNAIKILYDYLKEDNGTGACGGNLVDMNLCPVNSFGRRFPSFYEEFVSIFYLKPLLWRNPRSAFYNYTGKPLEVASIVGADLMVKRSVLDKVGYFSPDFFMNFEETELCFRIKKAGYRIMSVPEARIVHLEGQSSYISASRMQRYFEGQYVFFGKRYGTGGMEILYALIAVKCRLRQWQFRVLGSSAKIEYWKVKGETNKRVFNHLINK